MGCVFAAAVPLATLTSTALFLDILVPASRPEPPVRVCDDSLPPESSPFSQNVSTDVRRRGKCSVGTITSSPEPAPSDPAFLLHPVHLLPAIARRLETLRCLAENVEALRVVFPVAVGGDPAHDSSEGPPQRCGIIG